MRSRCSTSAPRRWGRSGCRPGCARRRDASGGCALAELVAPAAGLAREGVELNVQQAYIIEILGGIVTSTPEAAALFAPGGELLRAGQRLRQPELADALERLGDEGSAPFYEGDIGAAIVDWVTERGGLLTGADLAAYEPVDRAPVSVGYRGRTVLTNPPPSAGGILIARALADARRRAGAAGGHPAGRGDGAHPARAHPRVPRRPRRSRVRAALSGRDRRAGWARPPTSPRSTARAGRARSRAPTARRPASSFRAPAFISTTCSASRT